LTVKDLITSAIQDAFYCGNHPSYDNGECPMSPPWFPTTFNLELELPQFVSLFQRREKTGKDNTWIVKPWLD
jgi:tubulin--tyrosine ligase-like protein 12